MKQQCQVGKLKAKLTSSNSLGVIHGSRRSQPPAFTPRILPSPQSRAEVEEAVRARRRRRRPMVAAKAPDRHRMRRMPGIILSWGLCDTELKKKKTKNTASMGHGHFRDILLQILSRTFSPGFKTFFSRFSGVLNISNLN